MRPSCDHQAKPKPSAITQFSAPGLVSLSAGRFSPEWRGSCRPSPSGPDVPEEGQQDNANRDAAQHGPEHWVPAVMLRQPTQTLALDDPPDVAEEAHEACRRADRLLGRQVQRHYP